MVGGSDPLVVRTPFSFTPAFSECCAARGAAHYLDLETTTIARVRLPTTMKTNYTFSNFLGFSGVRLPTAKKNRVPFETLVELISFSADVLPIKHSKFLSKMI